jgi:cell division septum initiation protein DivIVA
MPNDSQLTLSEWFEQVRQRIPVEDREALARSLDEIVAERKNEQRLTDQVQELKRQVQAYDHVVEVLHTAISQADEALRQAGCVGLIAWPVEDGRCTGCWLGCEECVARQDQAFVDAAARETFERIAHQEQNVSAAPPCWPTAEEHDAMMKSRIRETARRVILRQDKTFRKLAKIRELPDADPRVETGTVQFHNDWPGLFIRGDDCFRFAQYLQWAISMIEDLPEAKHGVSFGYLGSLKGLLKALQATRVKRGQEG